jgi:hypothetical protein
MDCPRRLFWVWGCRVPNGQRRILYFAIGRAPVGITDGRVRAFRTPTCGSPPDPFIPCYKIEVAIAAHIFTGPLINARTTNGISPALGAVGLF